MATTFIARLTLTAVLAADVSAAAVLDNWTGLPAYPNLETASMDTRWRTEALGRQCVRFVATTSDALATVEAWYRRALLHASETNLANDPDFKVLATLQGIKLAQGTDYVNVYRVPNQPTQIELHRCSWNRR